MSAATGIVILILSAAGLVWALLSRKDQATLPGLETWARERVPVTIVLDDDLVVVADTLVDGVEDAIAFWNESLGFRIFADLGDLGSGAVVTIHPRSALETVKIKELDDFSFTRVITDDGAIQSASIYIDTERLSEVPEETLLRGISRELGHVLGLDDDDFVNSVMYHTLLEREAEVTAKDRVLLDSLYNRRNGQPEAEVTSATA